MSCEQCGYRFGAFLKSCPMCGHENHASFKQVPSSKARITRIRDRGVIAVSLTVGVIGLVIGLFVFAPNTFPSFIPVRSQIGGTNDSGDNTNNNIQISNTNISATAIPIASINGGLAQHAPQTINEYGRPILAMRR
jgi:hypothetical protein